MTPRPGVETFLCSLHHGHGPQCLDLSSLHNPWAWFAVLHKNNVHVWKALNPRTDLISQSSADQVLQCLLMQSFSPSLGAEQLVAIRDYGESCGR